MTLVAEKPSQNGTAKKTKTTLVKVKVTLTSKGNGILMNPMTEDLLDELAGVKSKAASDKNTPLPDRAALKVIRNEHGKIGLPNTYLYAALAAAGRHVKKGKDKISTATSTTLYEFLSIDQKFAEFKNQEEGSWIVDKRRGVLNNGGKSVAVTIIRPLFEEWETTFDITVDTDVTDVNIVKQLFEAAGSKIGVGDFRPAKKGPFGMFSVTCWDVAES